MFFVGKVTTAFSMQKNAPMKINIFLQKKLYKFDKKTGV